MPRIQQIRHKDTVALIEEYLERPDILHVVAEYVVHERSSGALCPCCGSSRALATARIPLTEFAIRVSDGARVYRDKTRPDVWEAVIDQAQRVDFPVRCTAITREIIDDQGTAVWLLLGGGRAQKTQTNAYRQAVVWLRRGGPGTRFWVIGPELKHAHIVKTKLFTGEQRADYFNPPIFPPELVTGRIPDGPVGKQEIRLVDGSVWELRHGRSTGSIKGEAPMDMLITEAGEIRSAKAQEFFVIAGQRMIDSGGTLGIDSTPMPSTPLETVYLASKDEDEDERKAAREGRTLKRFYRRAELASIDNPWNDPEKIARMRAEAAKISPQIARRDYDGEWVGANSLLFGEDWDPARHTFDTLRQSPFEIDLLMAELGLVDVTRTAARRHFTNGPDWVVGVDVNRNPHTHVICKIFERKGKPGLRGLMIFDVLRVWDTTSWHAAKRLADRNAGAYRGAGVGIDASSDHDNQHAAHTGGRATTPLKDYRAHGFDAKPPDYTRKGHKALNPRRRSQANLLKHLMREDLLLVNANTCQSVVKAFSEAQDAGDGSAAKESGSYTDRHIAAYLESTAYLAWPLLVRDVEARLIGRQQSSSWKVT